MVPLNSTAPSAPFLAFGGDSAASFDIAAARAGGLSFAGRYLPSPGGAWKQLTPEEVSRLKHAGISIVSIWETNPTNAAFFSVERGMNDGIAAGRAASLLGQPIDTPIYTTIDYDARAEADFARIATYLYAFRAAISPYKLGVYGGYWVIDRFRDLTPYLWQTYAWSDGRLHPSAALYQLHNMTAIDLDVAFADPGGWGAPLIPANISVTVGGRGFPVYVLQALLNVAGASPILTVDGIFGPITMSALNRYESTHELPETQNADSVVWTSLAASLHHYADINMESPTAKTILQFLVWLAGQIPAFLKWLAAQK